MEFVIWVCSGVCGVCECSGVCDCVACDPVEFVEFVILWSLDGVEFGVCNLVEFVIRVTMEFVNTGYCYHCSLESHPGQQLHFHK